jgi:hypothetical protein
VTIEEEEKEEEEEVFRSNAFSFFRNSPSILHSTLNCAV